MNIENGRNDLQSLLEAIKVSKVIENRIQLIKQLEESDISDKSHLALIAECLVTFWEESTCSGISQCMLNKSILHVAAKFIELESSDRLSNFLILGTKASVWCVKHLMIEESQDEKHSSLFFQLILDSLNFSSAIFSALTRSPLLGENVLMLIVESFVLEQLHLASASISQIQKIPSIASEVLKLAQVVLDAAIKLCRAYCETIKWAPVKVTNKEDLSSGGGRRVDNLDHVINITACTVENLYRLGTLAASGGGGLVIILNVSWKGVVSLLQLGDGVLADKINVGDIILTLISLVTKSLRCAAEAWSSTTEETLDVGDAKRIFLPIKFYLINAVRISSQYPCEALKVYKEINLCVLMISTFGILLSKEPYLKAASKALVEFLEPTSFLLLLSLLNSAEVKHESKLQILDWLFIDDTKSMDEIIGSTTLTNRTTNLEEIFSVQFEAMPKAKTVRLGQVVLFLSLLKSSAYLREEVVLGISTKLGLLLEFLINADVYSSILVFHIPVLCGSGATAELAWNPLYPSIVHALKTFMIVSSTSEAWMEVESFLLTNFLHPHFICWEIVIELWCFLIHHAETEMANSIIDGLCSLFKTTAVMEPSLSPGCALRKMARSICTLLTRGTQSSVDRFSSSIFNDDNNSMLSFLMITALLMESFQIDSLSDSLKKITNQRIFAAFSTFMENDGEKLELENSSGFSCSSVLVGLPVYAFAAMLQSLQTSSSDMDSKSFRGVLKLTVAVIHRYMSSTNSLYKNHYSKILCQTLEIISNNKHLYAAFDEMIELIMELHTLFLTGSSASDICLYQSKPALVSFMAGLGHMEMAEGEESATSTAVWDLYHMLLRERHWAFVHLALTAFGYFAARTSCNQLWRFVPPNAALSFDIETGKEASEERFMCELKGFLEKEGALLESTPCSEQFGLLKKEGQVLKQIIEKVASDLEVFENRVVDNDYENRMKKKRKLPDEINEGVALLQRGAKAMADGLACWSLRNEGSKELQNELSNQLSCLEDIISHLVGLAGEE